MPEKMDKSLSRVLKNTRTASSQNTSNTTSAAAPGQTDPNCPHCGGVGFLRVEVPPEDERFGRLELCVCQSRQLADNARQRLYEMSNLSRLSHLTFENFNVTGNKSATFITTHEQASLQNAFEAARTFAERLDGWLLLEGGYGCGKTHLAAAVANYAVANGLMTLFITVPDMLDSLRFAFSDPQTTFEQRFESIRNVKLLVLDDFGTQNATGWAQEKLFQIINYRYVNKLPTLITTNLMLDEIESRIRSRLQDSEFVNHIRIASPDYRRPMQTSNPGISLLSMPGMREMTFRNFETREDEIGKDVVTTVIVEKQDKFGNPVKSKEITKEKVTQDHIKRLHKAVGAASKFAEKPEGWLVLLGSSFCGKTHLAAAIGNYRVDLGGQAILVDVSSLLDYLRRTFRPSTDVSFDRRFDEICTTPLLILDDLKESGVNSSWAEDKLYQILNQRYYAGLPTVITSTLDPESFAKSYPALWNRLLDTTKCDVHVIDMPPYRRTARHAPVSAPRKGSRG